MPITTGLSQALQKRISEGTLRKLSASNGLIDFCSNDYLGFAKSNEHYNFMKYSPLFMGSTGSRLISGNSTVIEELENQIAKFHTAKAGLIFNSGYDANVGLFSSLARKGDTILYDEYIHASVHDGMRMGVAFTHSFRHNDINHLAEKLNASKGNIFIAIESVYSMDGDTAPLIEISQLAQKYNAALIVDEAHASGIYGKRGEGKVAELKLEDKVFARIHTFGKALGCHGAIILGDEILKNYLINFARSFIYTTALPPHSVHSIKTAYELLQTDFYLDQIQQLNRNINLFQKSIENFSNSRNSEITSNNFSPIQALIIPGNEKVKEISKSLQRKGYDVRPILSPTVPKGKERIRICLHSYNSENEIKGLIHNLFTTFFK
jgi:8-amino-7-oxononanoate synthase